MWQQRFFQLTATHLRYFRSDADTRAHAQLGQLALKNVIAVQRDSDSTEFIVVMANSQRAPYTLRAESVEDMRAWVNAIETYAPLIQPSKHAGKGSTSGSRARSMSDGDSNWLPAGQGHVADVPEEGEESET